MCFVTMWRTVFILIFLIVKSYCAAEGNLAIRLLLEENSAGALTCLNNDTKSTKLVVGKPIKIIVKSLIKNGNHFKCSSNDIQIFEITNFKDENGIFKAEEEKTVNQNWHKRWQCKFDGRRDECNITVDVRSLDLKPYVQANEGQLEIRNAEETDIFDSVTTYDFHDGEHVNFTCHKYKGTKQILNKLKLSSNAHGNIEVKFLVLPLRYLYLKLNKENDNHYVDCHATDFNGRYSYVIRINLHRSSGKISENAVGAPTKCGVSTTKGKINCVDGAVINNIQTNNILAMYYSNYYMFSILYEYDNDKILNLTCYALQLTWEYNDTEFDRVNGSNTKKTQSLQTFKLKTNVTRANIACAPGDNSAGKDGVEIILIRKEHHKDTDSTENSDHDNSGTSKPETDDGLVSGPGGMSQEVLIIIAVCALVFIGVLIFITIQLLKRKTVPPNPDSNVNYGNLRDPNNGNIPAPSRWQEAQYSAPADRIANNDYAVPFKPNLEEMYATPIPKDQRLDIDNSPHTSADNLNPTGKTMPKHLRNGIAVLPTNMESTYAELALKPEVPKKPMKNAATTSKSPYANSESPYEEVRFESPYAEVAMSENSYAEPSDLQSKGYVNVFNDPRYVNSNAKEDYAEPAYCEISKIQ